MLLGSILESATYTYIQQKYNLNHKINKKCYKTGIVIKDHVKNIKILIECIVAKTVVSSYGLEKISNAQIKFLEYYQSNKNQYIT